ncbi:hypothetical protein HWV23_14455 [Natronomonas halophila]|uniref:hypothetical protein n=1 Tax=Natronomonas halophila TaxID=2747817 RepID=UPI0015B3928E|nr:hypothetical protein [Natronomonas halophila]QLD86875.1 hypothetical protein HWV23_14455 [Natronomonas halophila]
MLTDLARTYSAVFAPEFFVLLCSLLVISYEWRTESERSLPGLGLRLGVLGLGWAVAFAIYQGVPLVVGGLPEWGTDFTGSAGLGVGILVIWFVWRRRDWGDLVPAFSLLLVGVTVPHLLITPIWDVSSHVIYAVVPAGYLLFVNVRFVPVAVIAVGMVFARPLAGAHTWLQSVAGLLLSVVFLLGLVRFGSLPEWRVSDERNPS